MIKFVRAFFAKFKWHAKILEQVFRSVVAHQHAFKKMTTFHNDTYITTVINRNEIFLKMVSAWNNVNL